ncbi:MAG: integrase [Gammaproteobacteria bacterium]|jgi:integrase|nr:integrase [Gammaproteobacteria bacterium]
MPISNITAAILLKTLRQVEKRGAVDTAHRLLNNTSQIFRYAIATSRAERDVAADLRGALPRVGSGHFSAVTKPAEVAQLLHTLDAYQGSLIVRSALRLAPLVFVRPGELRQARWIDIHFETAEWRYRATKTKTEHVVPLARQAIEILKELHPMTQYSEYVFPGERSHKRSMSTMRFWWQCAASVSPKKR